jgi:prepilin signal peptidase PulO-like enzyme (type II secretory pathway)
MDRESTTYLLSNLGSQVPALLVLAIATILAFLHLRRAFLASLLTLAGAAVMVATKFAVAFFQANLFEARRTGDQDPEEFGRMLAMIGFTGSCVQAVGLGLLVVAIFVGRGKLVREQT